MRNNRYVVGMVGIGIAWSNPASGAVRYARVGGTGGCTSWADACNLTSAIAGAVVPQDQVWVKAGTYSEQVSLTSGVAVIGGFAGTETLASQSNPVVNMTIVDGGGIQRPIESANNSAATAFRGFVLRNGRDTGDDGGGALLVADSSAVFVQCVFEQNSAGKFGGGVSIRGASNPKFVNCHFRNNGIANGTNTTPLGGGAIFVHDGSPSFMNCVFAGNNAGEGGAILIVNGNPSFVNSVFVANSAWLGDGGAIHDERGRTVALNSILWGNSAVRQGTQVYSIEGFTARITYSDIAGGFFGVGNINADPQFVSAASGDYSIQQTSPCKNAGQNSAIPNDDGDLDWDSLTSEQTPYDLYDHQRRQEFRVDMGVHETKRDPGNQ